MISDVIIDGVSMRASERSEFASVIQRSGGKVQGVLAMMRENAAPTSPSHPAVPPGVVAPFHPTEFSAPYQRLVANAMRLIRLGAQAPAAVGLVIGVVAFEPGHLAVALEG